MEYNKLVLVKSLNIQVTNLSSKIFVLFILLYLITEDKYSVEKFTQFEDSKYICNDPNANNTYNGDMNDKIIKNYGQTNYSNLIWRSKNSINIDKETADKLFKLLEILEDNDDVQAVSSNFEVDEDVMSSLTS